MIVRLELEDEDFPSLHDVVYEVTGYSYTNEELLKIFIKLPEDILLDAAKWGMNDTVVRDNIYEHLEKELKK
jgi:hypothetical protein